MYFLSLSYTQYLTVTLLTNYGTKLKILFIKGLNYHLLHFTHSKIKMVIYPNFFS